jgi:hypothetical protein
MLEVTSIGEPHMFETGFTLQNMPLEALQSLSSDFLGSSAGLPAPDNEYYATSASQTFTGVNGEVDYFIFDTNIDSGNYVVNNYEPEFDWLIFTADSGDSVEASAINGRVTYTNSTDSTHGHVDVNVVGDASGTSIATIAGDLIFL